LEEVRGVLSPSKGIELTDKDNNKEQNKATKIQARLEVTEVTRRLQDKLQEDRKTTTAQRRQLSGPFQGHPNLQKL